MAGLSFGGLFGSAPLTSDDGKALVENSFEDAGRTKTQIWVYGNCINSYISYTVPAGKIFLLTQVMISSAVQATTVSMELTLTRAPAAETDIMRWDKYNQNNDIEININFNMPLRFVAGDLIKLKNGVGVQSLFSFFGWLENA